MNDKQKLVQFLEHHNACEDGIGWAIKNCNNLQDAWNKARSEWIIWAATRDGILSDRELHEFALWCANSCKYLMTDKRSIEALDAKRKWLDGQTSVDELAAARAAAAGAAAWDAAWATAGAAAADAQAEWLRSNTKPNMKDNSHGR